MIELSGRGVAAIVQEVVRERGSNIEGWQEIARALAEHDFFAAPKISISSVAKRNSFDSEPPGCCRI